MQKNQIQISEKAQEKKNRIVFEQGRWSQEEKLKYLIFLQVQSQKFVRANKRIWKIYKALSKYVKTRSPQQCRSHHRKLLLRYQTVNNIIQNGKKKYQIELYEKQQSFYIKEHLKENIIEKNYTRVPKVVTKELPQSSSQNLQLIKEIPNLEPLEYVKTVQILDPVIQASQSFETSSFWNISPTTYFQNFFGFNPYLMMPYQNLWLPY